MEEYENMVEIIKKEYSNAKLVIGEILPRYYHERLKTAELEQKRCQFNLLLKDKNLKLVQYDHVRTTDFYDGIHLNQEGIKNFVKNLKEVINPLVDVRSPTENHRQYNKNQSYNGKGCQQFYQNRLIRNPRNWNPGVDYRYNRYNQTNQYFGRSDYNGSVK